MATRTHSALVLLCCLASRSVAGAVVAAVVVRTCEILEHGLSVRRSSARPYIEVIHTVTGYVYLLRRVMAATTVGLTAFAGVSYS